MKDTLWLFSLISCFAAFVAISGCNAKVEAGGGTGVPPPAEVEYALDGTNVRVDHPEQFPLVTASRYEDPPELNVTGAVSADVSRQVPVISLASGRVAEIRVRLGDTVQPGQLLMRVLSTDISDAFSVYRQAIADQKLARAQLDRAKVLYEKGATAMKDLEVAEDAAAKAEVTVESAREHLRVLGANPEQPTSIVDIHAPVGGVITEQNVTNAAGVKTLDNSPNLFTISDISRVWIVCDVYENDLPFVRMGEYADIHINAYPKLTLRGRIANIASIMDPNIRTAKVRLEVNNPGILRLGMFVTAVFRGVQKESLATVPAPAVLHLHDRDWVYIPEGNGKFRRVEVNAGKILPGNLQVIGGGLKAGEQVVASALVLQNTVEQ